MSGGGAGPGPRADEGELARELRAVFAEAIRRLDPRRAVREALAGAAPAGQVEVIALGKAAVAMAAGARDALGDRIAAGQVVAPEPAEGAAPLDLRPLDVSIGAHPVPDARSERAGRALVAAVATPAPAAAWVLALVSGGGSALAAVPADGLALADKAAAVRAVAAAGADIYRVNTVRKHLSAIKGGRLAAASAVPVATLVASDVVGDDLSAVASGPTVPDSTTFSDACEAVAASCGWAAVPAPVRAHLEAGRRGEIADTPSAPRPGDTAALVAGTGTLVDRAREAAAAAGFAAGELDRAVTGAVDAVADRLAEAAGLARADARAAGRAVARVAGGEPTIALPPRPGRGGRAQQLALAVARRIAGLDRVAVLCAGSDGIDGNSDAAGAVVTGATWEAIRAGGSDPAAALARCDANPALAAAGAVVVTGRTGVNHADLMVVAAAPGPAAGPVDGGSDPG